MWFSDGHRTAFVLPRDVVKLLKRSFNAVDRLYALGLHGQAESLDALVEELLDDLDNAGAELDAESPDVSETGIEDYELDESVDEGDFRSASGLYNYWEPDMLVASDAGFQEW